MIGIGGGRCTEHAPSLVAATRVERRSADADISATCRDGGAWKDPFAWVAFDAKGEDSNARHHYHRCRGV